MELSGKVVLLTGATGGLGRAIARSLAGRGATLVLSSRKGTELEELARSLPGDGHRFLVADLATEGEGVRLAAEAGAVDVFVANAGLPASGHLVDFSQAEVGRALRVNLESPVRIARELAPGMSSRGDGHMVFISSLAGKAIPPRSSLYAATKAGLRAFALSLRQDLHTEGIGVSVVLPGFIREAGMFADSGAQTPSGLGTSTPEEVGDGVVEAIEGDRGEVEVAPLQQRFLAGFAHRYPRIAGRIQRGSTGSRAADEVARGQTDKR